MLDKFFTVSMATPAASTVAVLGTATVDAAGVATLTVNPLTSTLAVTASYSGDSVYAASTSCKPTLR